MRRKRGRRPPGSEPILHRYLRLDRATGLDSVLADAGWDGVVFGAEFCVRRLPPVDEVVSVARTCAETGKDFCLTTPPVREGAWEMVEGYLRTVASRLPGVECVCNDWGVLRWAAEEELPLRLSAGRLLSRQRRGPRVLELIRESAPEEARALRGSAWDDPVNVETLLALGVARVELDFLLQGTRRPHLPPGVALTVCAPWIPVTVTPACAYTDSPLHCAHDCLAHPAVRQSCAQHSHPLWTRGNAVFVRSDLQAPYQAVAKLGADRLVWAEELPG